MYVLTGVVWLHSLQSMTEHAPAINLDLALLGDNRALDVAPGPEVVVHATPWLFGVCAVVACSIFSALEARSSSGELHIDQTAVVDCSLDGVCRTIFAELDGDAVGVERVVSFVEAVIRQWVARPKERLLVVGVEELGVELHRCARTEDVVVDDLEEANMASVGVEVESLRLDVGVVESLPLQVLLGQLGVRRVACILSDRLDSFRTVDRLLGSGNCGQSAMLSGHDSRALAVHARHGRVSRITRGSRTSRRQGFTYADLAQLNILRDGRDTIQNKCVSDWWWDGPY